MDSCSENASITGRESLSLFIGSQFLLLHSLEPILAIFIRGGGSTHILTRFRCIFYRPKQTLGKCTNCHWKWPQAWGIELATSMLWGDSRWTPPSTVFLISLKWFFKWKMSKNPLKWLSTAEHLESKTPEGFKSLSKALSCNAESILEKNHSAIQRQKKSNFFGQRGGIWSTDQAYRY